MSWIELCRDIGVFGIASFFIQRIINNASARALAQYKQELEFTIRGYQLTLDTDLERYKSELNLHLSQQSSLYERRMNIVDEMYKLLVHLKSAMNDMTGIHIVYDDGEQEDKDRIQKAQEAFSNYNNFFLFHKLYFNKSVSALLENIRAEYFSANFDYFEPRRLSAFTGGRPTPEGYKAAVEKSHLASKRIRDEIPKILEELEEEFRKLMGVS